MDAVLTESEDGVLVLTWKDGTLLFKLSEEELEKLRVGKEITVEALLGKV